MTSKQIEALIKKLESYKSTSSAKTFLNRKGIETSEGFKKSYDFNINGEKYRIVKHANEDTCKVIRYTNITIENDGTRVVPMCYGAMVRI